jgi:hypothetical protein
MEAFSPKQRNAVEAAIQKDIIRMLEAKGWAVASTHGTALQAGFPDLYASHAKMTPCIRWIEVKQPVGYKITDAQRKWFPKFTLAGTGIWILCAATEHEYSKLFRPPNWQEYWPRY